MYYSERTSVLFVLSAGCFRVGENSTVNATGNDASTRRRRDLEEFVSRGVLVSRN